MVKVPESRWFFVNFYVEENLQEEGVLRLEYKGNHTNILLRDPDSNQVAYVVSNNSIDHIDIHIEGTMTVGITLICDLLRALHTGYIWVL